MVLAKKLSCTANACCKGLDIEPWLVESLNDEAIKLDSQAIEQAHLVSISGQKTDDTTKQDLEKQDVVEEVDVKAPLTDAEKALVVESFLKFSAMDGEKSSRLEVGTRVQRGPDWKYGNQDGGPGRLGLVTSGSSATSSKWAYVKWDCGHYDSYRWGQQNKYDLKLVKAGVLLFKNLFLLSPETLQLFPFKDEEELYDSPKIKSHSAKVIGLFRFAVAGLADLERLRPTLQEMGKRHAGYGVKPRHYEVLGEALINTLKIALNDAWGPVTEGAWRKVYDRVSTMMTSEAYSLTLPIAAVSREPLEKEGDGAARTLKVSQVDEVAESKKIQRDEQKTQPKVVEEAKPTDAAPEKVAVEKKQPSAPAKQASEKEERRTKSTEAAKKAAMPPKAETAKDEAAEAQSAEDGKKGEAEPKASPKKKKITHKERLEKWKVLPLEEQEAKRDELQLASKGGELATVLRLLDTGMIANAADDDGCTALHLAAHAGHRKVIIALLNASADPKRATRSSGRTAVMLAATKRREDALELLVPRSNLAAVDAKGFTVADLAKDEAAEWLRNDPLNNPPPWKVRKEKEASKENGQAS